MKTSFGDNAARPKELRFTPSWTVARVQGHHRHGGTLNLGLCKVADFAGKKQQQVNKITQTMCGFQTSSLRQGEYLPRLIKKSIREREREREDDTDREGR